MDFIWDSITDWLKEILVSGIVSNLSGMFDSTNEQVGNIVGQVGMTPQSWNIWTCMGYTVLLCFCLFKTSSLARSVFNAH